MAQGIFDEADELRNENAAHAGDEHDTGTVISISRTEDDRGRAVLRATVDFYDGACPDLTFATVWKKTPVRIIEAKE